jgi:hypothetical protein
MKRTSQVVGGLARGPHRGIRTRGRKALRRTRSTAAALLVAAVSMLVMLGSAASASAEETCSSAVGEASGTVNKERQRVVNTLSTNLLEKQSFTFTWENGLERVTLEELTAASCIVTSGGRRKFSGEGAARYNGEEGYTVKFAISITNKGVNEVVMRLFEGKERVASFKFAALAAETIS